MTTYDDMQIYCDCMQQIRGRLQLIDGFITGNVSMQIQVADVEFQCLQFRKIFELIAFSSLAANRVEYAKLRPSFAKEWRARDILTRLEEIHPSFYPRPYEKVDGSAVAVTSGFLTKEDLADAYDECSGAIHAFNPYSEGKLNANLTVECFREWFNRIASLLALHLINIAFTDHAYWVDMNYHGGERNHVIVWGLRKRQS